MSIKQKQVASDKQIEVMTELRIRTSCGVSCYTDGLALVPKEVKLKCIADNSLLILEVRTIVDFISHRMSDMKVSKIESTTLEDRRFVVDSFNGELRAQKIENTRLDQDYFDDISDK